MKVAKTRSELAEALAGSAPGEIRFVPTMGALHQGHLSLVRGACQGGGVVVVSLFVNPTQFNDPADLRNYPRTPSRDLDLLEEAGVDVAFMPTVDEIYPEPDSRVFDFGTLDKVMEGATRPGHFNGVAQVVSRLFDIVRPARAFFGQKDFQQVAVIRAMVAQAVLAGESWAGVEIVECPTVREADGLALSSRNTLLTPEHRSAAPDIHRALALGSSKAGTMPPRELESYIAGEIERSGLLKVIYCSIVDRATLRPAKNWEGESAPVACVAVQAGSVRLIDNAPMGLR